MTCALFLLLALHSISVEATTAPTGWSKGEKNSCWWKDNILKSPEKWAALPDPKPEHYQSPSDCFAQCHKMKDCLAVYIWEKNTFDKAKKTYYNSNEESCVYLTHQCEEKGSKPCDADHWCGYNAPDKDPGHGEYEIPADPGADGIVFDPIEPEVSHPPHEPCSQRANNCAEPPSAVLSVDSDTCLQDPERDLHNYYKKFVSGKTCSSLVGRVGSWCNRADYMGPLLWECCPCSCSEASAAKKPPSKKGKWQDEIPSGQCSATLRMFEDVNLDNDGINSSTRITSLAPMLFLVGLVGLSSTIFIVVRKRRQQMIEPDIEEIEANCPLNEAAQFEPISLTVE